MEPQKEPVSVRVHRINTEITTKCWGSSKSKNQLLNRETILDVLQTLYEECSIEGLQKVDSNITEFVKKYQNDMKEIKMLRVNISDFEIKNIIGCGHFGEVHLVKEKQTGDVYAMKTIRKFDHETKKMSYEEERNIMAFSSSPWITSLQYSFQDSSYLFFVMDYHPGGDLLGHLYRNGGTLPERAALFYLAEIILALEDLHGMGYVHRDLKPDNILLDRCGHIKLADFGSAAKLDKEGMVKVGPPVGTPDYIAPEVLQCLDNKSNEKSSGYGVSCDFWSLGVLAYELTIGNPPFQGQSSASVYSKVMNHSNSLKFPHDVALTQGYVNFVKGLITDAKSRLKLEKIKSHAVFKGMHFDTLREQVPPYVPKVTSPEDTSNFNDVHSKKKHPSIENFKRRSQFSGRNLPFIGFTYTHNSQGSYESNFPRPTMHKTDLELIENLRIELAILRMQVAKSEDFKQEKLTLEQKLDATAIKLQSLEGLRDKLEKQLAESLAESSAVKRTLHLERKERINLEKKALDLIKGAKLKWELAEKTKIEALELEIKQLNSKNEQLANTNSMLNEQLQHALKMEEKNRLSLETEQKLNRRSVVGLENLLEKATADRQNKISELQSKLKDESSANSSLQSEICRLQDALEEKQSQIVNLNDRLSKSKTDYDELQQSLCENIDLVQELNSKVNELEKDLQRIDEYEKEIEVLRRHFDDSQKTIKELQSKISILQRESKQLENCKKEGEEARRKTSETQLYINELQKELEQKNEQCKDLKKRLEEVEASETKTQELREKQLQFYKQQKELSDCKIDKRILERELKEAKGEIKKLEEKITQSEKVLDESKRAQEAAVLELSGINESISIELVKAKENIKSLQDQLQNERSKTDDEKCIIKELKTFLSTKDESVRNLDSNIRTLKNELQSLETRCNREEAEKSKLLRLVEQLQQEKLQLNETIEKGKTDTSNMKLNLDGLREACTLLESQVIEYEKLVEISTAKQTELSGNIEKLIADLFEARKETQEVKRHINEEKSLRAIADQKIKHLQENIDRLEKECADYKALSIEYKECSSGLSEELAASENKLCSTKVMIKTCDRQIDNLTVENRSLKEEISGYLTKIAHLKESKYKLSHQVSDLNKTVEELLEKSNELERILHEKENYHKEREVKANARDKQHLKLIDYLQSKIEEQSHKKKTLSEVIFGSSKKENQPPISLALNYRDLELELLKERENNTKLREELFKLKVPGQCEANSFNLANKVAGKIEKSKSQIMSPRTIEALEQITTPRSNQTQFNRNGSSRMHHNIPHRFESKLNTIPQKCALCQNPILLGRNHHVCKECSTVAHVTCSVGLPKVCGLPKQLVEHFKGSLEHIKNNEIQEKQNEEALCEGWVKVACIKSGSWEKRYARLTNSSLDIYTQPPTNAGTMLLNKFPVISNETFGKVILEPLQSEIGIPVADSDIPFVLKIEVGSETSCWPSKYLALMALTAKDKDNWFAALQKKFASNPSGSKVHFLFKLPSHTVVNCVVAITENILVLGTDKGLFAHYDNNLLHIEGPARIEQIVVFTLGKAVVMIEGSKSTLITCDLNHLITLAQCSPCAKPTLNYQQVKSNNLSGFHILQVSKYQSQKKIAAATRKQLVIHEYYLDTNEFLPVRIVDTAQPSSCILFTENSLIVGADKFFEIDMNTFNAEEFLDPSDLKLKHVSKCYKLGSFPVAIVEVCSNPKEYLLAYKEFLLFVDEYGRSSRSKEIKNQHLPISLHLANKHYLYIIQFGAIEVLKIAPESCSSEDALESYRMELTEFKYLGANDRGVFLEQGGEVRFFSARNLPDFDALSTVSDGTTMTNDSDNLSQFSFTSSIAQSLDGHLSDSVGAEQMDVGPSRVRFDQTDL
ncbi:citron Rho-interacting kinase-like [Euwallacea fornicatus]|uniref:citron Rho-interacting kinase-like n=1 Tax=Euwallacea fornicatus TaxID=995702 RepID=UPI00338FBE47